jgi:hypothetical protein
MSEKISSHHLARKAILYIRQSSAYHGQGGGACDLSRIEVSPGEATPPT